MTLKLVKKRDCVPVIEGIEYWGKYLTRVHHTDQCRGQPCTLHNMTNHHMRHMSQYWRVDRGIMERTCKHGVGHPDPDDYICNLYAHERVHGCDGCCFPPKKD